MSNEIEKTTTSREVDGFGGYTDAVEGGGEERRSSAPILKFTNDAEWTVRDEPMDANREFVMIDVSRSVVKWPPEMDGGGPVEVITLAPGQRFPDVDKLNADTPKNEWRTGPDGQLRGPWQTQHTAHLLDPDTMDRLNWPTSTIGGSIAVREVVERTQWMRRFRGENVFPVVTLGDTFMNTRFGGRQRPHLNIKRFVTFGSGGGIVKVDPPLVTKGETVAPPSAKEATGDSIPY